MVSLIGEEKGKLRVRCECGREFLVTKSLYKKREDNLLCGLCKPDGQKDLSGCVFDRLTVIKRVVNTEGGSAQWLCRCICGNEVTRTSTGLLRGKNHSCGCHLPPVAPSPFKVRPYRIYYGMIKRCEDPKSQAYHNYGGRGIKVCDRWKESFDNFWEDMKDGYRDDLQLDRINNNGNYELGNCRWATPKQNSRNKRTNHVIKTALGEMTVVEQTEIARVNPPEVYRRLTLGMPEELAIVPKQTANKNDIPALKHLYAGDATIVAPEEAEKIKGIIKTAEIQAKAVKDWGIGPDEIILADEIVAPTGFEEQHYEDGVVLRKKKNAWIMQLLYS